MRRLLLLLLLPSLLLAESRDQYVQILYRINLNGQIENDIEGIRGLKPYSNFQSRQKDLCISDRCIISIHQGLLTEKTELLEPIRKSNLFDLFVPEPGKRSGLEGSDDYFTERTLKPGQFRRHRLENLHLIFYSLPDCSHESTSLLGQVYRSQADADLFIVFLPGPQAAGCVDFQPPENPYHSLYDLPEKQTARTLILSAGERFHFFRDRRGTYRCKIQAPHLARLRLHFRGRQLLGVEGSEERFLEEQRNYPL